MIEPARPEAGYVLPTALYSCTAPLCREECTFTPDLLKWWPGHGGWPPGFYCDAHPDSCLQWAIDDYRADNERAEDGEPAAYVDPVFLVGVSLADELAYRANEGA